MARGTDDVGLTLVELLVAVVILSVIMGTISMSIIVSFRTTDEATGRLARAHDVQISTAAFASDVQSADLVHGRNHGTSCGPATNELTFVWLDGTVQNTATYSLSGSTLTRHHCVGAVVRPQVLSSNVDVATTRLTEAQCLTGATMTACAAAGSAPREVAWQITADDGSSHTLRGTRRVA